MLISYLFWNCFDWFLNVIRCTANFCCVRLPVGGWAPCSGNWEVAWERMKDCDCLWMFCFRWTFFHSLLQILMISYFLRFHSEMRVLLSLMWWPSTQCSCLQWLTATAAPLVLFSLPHWRTYPTLPLPLPLLLPLLLPPPLPNLLLCVSGHIKVSNNSGDSFDHFSDKICIKMLWIKTNLWSWITEKNAEIENI